MLSGEPTVSHGVDGSSAEHDEGARRAGRWCSFPGERGGLDTRNLYAEFANDVADLRVVDVGSGSGVGCEAFARATSFTGVDVSEAAVRYATARNPRASFGVGDAAHGVPAADVVTMVDVLGHVEEPESVLAQARTALPSGGLLCLAEPKASLAQALEAPQRRAFSENSLRFLLEGAGFRVRSLVARGGFLVVRAEIVGERPSVAEALAALQSGVQKLEPHLACLSGGTSAERVLRSEILARLGRIDAAFGELLEAHRASSEDAEVLARLAALCADAGSPEEARRFVRGALEREPTNALALALFARVESPHVSPEEALGLWSNAARVAPANVDVAVELARSAASLEHYHLGTLALERVRQYHEALPPEFYLTAGFLWALCGDFERAGIECAHAALLAPTNEGVGELRAFIDGRVAA